MAQKIGVVSLGCCKNLVDSEQMLWLLRAAGYEITPDAEGADCVVVNTCSFIESAKAEAIQTILELVELKKEGRLGSIVAAGCMSQRYGLEVLKELPEVDGLVGCGSVGQIAEAVSDALAGKKPCLFGDIGAPIKECARVLSTPPYSAYLKIAEGCDNCCTYCVIPSIRGKFRSRAMAAILAEAQALVQSGVKELIVAAQDITRYGLDLTGKRMLPELLEGLCKTEGVEWIRLHYLYPDGIDEALISVIEKNDKILRYLDIPIQHISDPVLKRMNRRMSGEEIERLFLSLRARLPGLVLRTSLIAGFPGETKRDFAALCAFLKRMKIERAGVFPYSEEEGTPAAEMKGQVSSEEKYRRTEIIMGIQQRVTDAYNKAMRGRTIRVLCEGYDQYAGCQFGRSYADSPEIDGKVFFKSKKRIPAGQFVNVTVTGRIGGDLRGRAEEQDG